MILAAPMVAGAAISAADPSGLWGLLKEGTAALVQAKQDTPHTSPLVKAVADDFSNSEARGAARNRVQSIFKTAQRNNLKRQAIEELRSVASILDRKAPEDAVAYKTWLQEIAQKAAEAAKEGGFLGFGGVPVSEAEKATLAEISAALNTPATRDPSAEIIAPRLD